MTISGSFTEGAILFSWLAVMFSKKIKPSMHIDKTPITRTCEEAEIYNGLLDLTSKHILELGCGAAVNTRAIAEANPSCHIDGLEVDETQHHKNQKITDLPNVTFKLSGAEKIPAQDNTYEIVFMFKSLHHVPGEYLDQAMHEINRVLKPAGLAYISEPLYAGDFNDMLKLFHDEKVVREHAFTTMLKAVDSGILRLKDEIFFNVVKYFKNFRQFEQDVIKATFNDHHLDEHTYQKVRQQFEKNMRDDGSYFTAPFRVDLFEKPSGM